MIDALWAGAVLAILGGAAGLGRFALARLPADHRSRETLDFTRLVTSLLVTFVALVLGLLAASVNASFEKTGGDLQLIGENIIRLTATLDEFGPATQPIRADLRRYVASALASTWPEESRPSGDYPQANIHGVDFDAPNLGDILEHVDLAIVALDAPDPIRQALKAACTARLEAVRNGRWTLIGEAHHALSTPFLAVTVLWLAVIFVSFGLNAPPNALAGTALGLAALCVSLVLFVLLELDGPLDGAIKVSSEPMRHALRHLDRSLDPRSVVPSPGAPG